MRTLLALPLACLVLQAGDPWIEALACLKREVPADHLGCLVYLERLDATSLRVRVLAQGTRFAQVEGEPLGQPEFRFNASARGGSGDLRLVTEVPEGARLLRLRLHGEAFSPEVLLHLPKAGEAAGVLLQTDHAPVEKGLASR